MLCSPSLSRPLVLVCPVLSPPRLWHVPEGTAPHHCSCASVRHGLKPKCFCSFLFEGFWRAQAMFNKLVSLFFDRATFERKQRLTGSFLFSLTELH
jgi:hypothetical protein